MAAPIDVRAGLSAELKRLVRDGAEWPIRDRRRFRNLLLDAVTSDAMPLAELLLRAHDDGMLRTLPDRTAARPAWDTAAARLASDLQVQRFVEPGIARFVAEAWASALGPDPIPSARVASPRPVVAPRQVPRSSATLAPPSAAATGTAAASRSAAAARASSAASQQLYQRSNKLLMGMAVLFTVFVVLAYRDANQRVLKNTGAAPAARSAEPPAPLPSPAVTEAPATPMAAPAPVSPVPDGANDPVAVSGDTIAAAPPSAPATGRPSVPVSSAPPRTTDDIVLNAGRVFEGRVLSVRQQSIVVKDEETGLDFEIAKSDVDRIVTRDGRVMRFSEDNVPLLGDDDDLTPMSLAGRYRVRYAERWGAERAECSDMARRFAPGTELIIRHLRGAPMMKLEFVRGQGFNSAVRSDGLFESGADVATTRGPRDSFVSVRISGRVSRGGVLQGVTRLSAVTTDGAVVCDLALTMTGDRQP
ncbi:MAG: hypothetical protein U5K74_14570 [Gemmatimonadaceae bacterium]|nr:hypothetical protein [Gemmatimonadaceae bacterium]